jgi:hypothetical protein
MLDFLKIVYKFSPFKDEEGNMKRHIVNPINETNDTKNRLLLLKEYCKNYIREKNFELKIN